MEEKRYCENCGSELIFSKIKISDDEDVLLNKLSLNFNCNYNCLVPSILSSLDLNNNELYEFVRTKIDNLGKYNFNFFLFFDELKKKYNLDLDIQQIYLRYIYLHEYTDNFNGYTKTEKKIDSKSLNSFNELRIKKETTKYFLSNSYKYIEYFNEEQYKIFMYSLIRQLDEIDICLNLFYLFVINKFNVNKDQFEIDIHNGDIYIK